VILPCPPGELAVVIDRIEPPVATVEWSPGAFTDLPLLALPPSREGDALCVRVAPPPSRAGGQDPVSLLNSRTRNQP
jgi:hypothetical protein